MLGIGCACPLDALLVTSRSWGWCFEVESGVVRGRLRTQPGQHSPRSPFFGPSSPVSAFYLSEGIAAMTILRRVEFAARTAGVASQGAAGGILPGIAILGIIRFLKR